eukprot:CAMPEP_0171099418 /NCGR_PEP_ID=MMETSP0766_2-20121228/51456_1 /TAXON_ID=439317 /ORGANISM="Gambierdiscus australes, Strain CAWD 149" /LENGTH=153 /DNA_ID=CAMNT_0011559035 /DNA_START=121 /DNA_END=580 /DNA_ORIENTATION=-
MPLQPLSPFGRGTLQPEVLEELAGTKASGASTAAAAAAAAATARAASIVAAASARAARRGPPWGQLVDLARSAALHVEETPDRQQHEQEEVQGGDSATQGQRVTGVKVADGVLVRQGLQHVLQVGALRANELTHALPGAGHDSVWVKGAALRW